MTRFARAKGSKASNEKVPESATSWSEMKQELLNKNKELAEKMQREAAMKKREESYRAFLHEKEEEEEKKVQWADFPQANRPHGAKLRTMNGEHREQTEKNKVKRLNKTGKKQKITSGISHNDAEPKLGRSNGNEIEGQISAGSNNNPTEISDIDKLKLEKRLERRKKQKEKRQLKRQNAASKKTENLTEQDLKKLEKKKAKLVRQAEKRKQFKQDTVKEIEPEDKVLPPQKPEKKNRPANNKINAEVKPQKKPKLRDSNQEHKRRKGKPERMIINGKTIDVDYIDGFPVKKEDADRLRQLRKEMISKGLPRSEINASLKLERRRAEKAFAREKKNVCFKCRKSGHNLSECPELDRDQVADTAGTGICFKCGSTEHTHFECKVVRSMDYKFATCFICNEQGHIAKQCPDNQRGLYPKGGACKVCGDVTHLKKDCPKYQAQQAQLQNSLSIGTLDNGNPDDFDGVNGAHQHPTRAPRRLNKVVKF